jgi:hypothetical protein
MLPRLLLALVLIAGLIFVAFVAYKGSQPMQQNDANGMSYWQFVRDRIGAIRELPATQPRRWAEDRDCFAAPDAARSDTLPECLCEAL